MVVSASLVVAATALAGKCSFLHTAHSLHMVGAAHYRWVSYRRWDPNGAPSRVMRRLMQQKNKEVRGKARTMFNDKVRI